MNSQEAERLLTVEEIADRLRVKVSWVYNHKDALAVRRVGRYIRFSWADVLERLKELSPQSEKRY